MSKAKQTAKVRTLIALTAVVISLFTLAAFNTPASEPNPDATTPPTTAKLHSLKTEPVVHKVIDLSDMYPGYAPEMIGRTIWGEAGGVQSEAERAAVAWCILNRVDAWGQTIEQVVTTPMQFQGYRDESWGECPEEYIWLAHDVLSRWVAEKKGDQNSGRVLPPEYLYFMGDGERNHFTTEYLSSNYWDWSLTDPYITTK